METPLIIDSPPKAISETPAVVTGDAPKWYVDAADSNYRVLDGSNISELKQKTDGPLIYKDTPVAANFKQQIETRRPLLVSNGINGRPSLRTDRNNASQVLASQNSVAFVDKFTFFLMFKVTQLSVFTETSLAYFEGNGGNFAFVDILHSTNKIRCGVVSDIINSDVVVALDTVYLVTIRQTRVDADLFNMRVNKVNQTEVLTTHNSVWGGNFYFCNNSGASRGGSVDFGRWYIGYNDYLTDDQCATIEQQYLDYYGV